MRDANGTAWLLVGTDSGVEGRTARYYTTVKAEFKPRQDSVVVGTGTGLLCHAADRSART